VQIAASHFSIVVVKALATVSNRYNLIEKFNHETATSLPSNTRPIRPLRVNQQVPGPSTSGSFCPADDG